MQIVIILECSSLIDKGNVTKTLVRYMDILIKRRFDEIPRSIFFFLPMLCSIYRSFVFRIYHTGYLIVCELLKD
uniref:Uncharacterized protein n=1 Tax=Pararge aegeria TaxID=116150 RepID=S4PB79_9NEOP